MEIKSADVHDTILKRIHQKGVSFLDVIILSLFVCKETVNFQVPFSFLQAVIPSPSPAQFPALSEQNRLPIRADGFSFRFLYQLSAAKIVFAVAAVNTMVTAAIHTPHRYPCLMESQRTNRPNKIWGPYSRQ